MFTELNYDILRVIWWILLGLGLVSFAISWGLKLGIGILLLLVSKNDKESQFIARTQPSFVMSYLWLSLGAAITLTAWPMIYAVLTSGLYIIIILIVSTLAILDFRNKFCIKIDHPLARKAFDWGIFLLCLMTSLAIGVTVGNILQGIPFYIDTDMVIHFNDTLWDLFTPFTLMCSIISASMVTHHAALYLATSPDTDISRRAQNVVNITTFVTLALFSIAGLYASSSLEGYQLTSTFVANQMANPLSKTVTTKAGLLMHNFDFFPWMISAPAIGLVATFLSWHIKMLGDFKSAFVMSAIAIFGVIATAVLSLYPFIIPSSYDPKSSLTVWDACSDYSTLFILLCVTAAVLLLFCVSKTKPLRSN